MCAFGFRAGGLELGDVGLGAALVDLLGRRLGGGQVGLGALLAGHPRLQSGLGLAEAALGGGHGGLRLLDRGLLGDHPLPGRGEFGLGHAILGHRLVVGLLRDGVLGHQVLDPLDVGGGMLMPGVGRPHFRVGLLQGGLGRRQLGLGLGLLAFAP